jgi:hypothetical protein
LNALLFPALLFLILHLSFEYIIVLDLQHKIKCWTFMFRTICFYCCRTNNTI